MPLYIALVTYTDRGMQAVRDSPRRLDQAKAQTEQYRAETERLKVATDAQKPDMVRPGIGAR